MVKLVVYDFDGVLTDNRVWVTQDGAESVACSRGDGWWIGEIKKLGVDQVILSSELNPVVSMRGKKLGIEVVQGVKDKKQGLLDLARTKGIGLESICYIGNEMNDYQAMKLAGVSACPADSHPEILKLSRLKFPVAGGAGVVRHLYDWLTEQGKPVTESRSIASASGKWREKIRSAMESSIEVKQALLQDEKSARLIEEMGVAMQTCLAKGGKILFAGNGGSFADAMHLAAEFVSKLLVDRAPLASIALGCANSNLTAIGNDYGYEHTFSREVRALGNAGDIFVAISTSGNSKNILEAVRAAKEKGITVYGWSGATGGVLVNECPTLLVPSRDTARIQECHIMIGHILCEIAEAPFLEKR